MNWFNRLKTYWILRRHGIPDHDWLRVTRKLPLLKPLSASEKARLRVLSTLFIHSKSFEGVQGIEINLDMKIIIAAQACLEVLALGFRSLEGWGDIVIYPGAFRVNRDTQDEYGLVHQGENVLSGEAWVQGPVILSWEDVERDSYTLRSGQHVVLHEFAHKLDMLNGRANGMPPLHPNMAIAEWTESLSEAYALLITRVENRQNRVNSYAATNPAEFFAVMCEYFFTAPGLLKQRYPKVYKQLKSYFAQDPVTRYL